MLRARNEASSCPGIFSRTLCFYYVASSPGSPFPHLLDRHRKLAGRSAIPARSCPGPVWYHWGSIVELEVPSDETPGLMTLHPHNTNPIRDKKTNVFDTSMASPSRQHNFTVRVSHRYIITAAECGHSRHRPSLGAPAVEYIRFSEFGRSRHIEFGRSCQVCAFLDGDDLHINAYVCWVASIIRHSGFNA